MKYRITLKIENLESGKNRCAERTIEVAGTPTSLLPCKSLALDCDQQDRLLRAAIDEAVREVGRP